MAREDKRRKDCINNMVNKYKNNENEKQKEDEQKEWNSQFQFLGKRDKRANKEDEQFQLDERELGVLPEKRQREPGMFDFDWKDN